MVTTTKRQYEWNRKFQFFSWETDKEPKRNTKSKSICMVIELQMNDVESGIIVTFFLFFILSISYITFDIFCEFVSLSQNVTSFFSEA